MAAPFTPWPSLLQQEPPGPREAGEKVGKGAAQHQAKMTESECWHPQKMICLFEKSQSSRISHSAPGSAYAFGVFSTFPQDTSQAQDGLPLLWFAPFLFPPPLPGATNLPATGLGSPLCTSLQSTNVSLVGFYQILVLLQLCWSLGGNH